MYKHLIFFILCISLMSCTTLNLGEKVNTNIENKQLLLEKDEPKYEVDFKKLEELETEPPNFIYLKQINNEYVVTDDENDFDIVAIPVEDLSKIERLLDLKNTYKKLSKEQYELINILENKINVIKDIANYQYILTQEIQKENEKYKKEINKNIKWIKIDNITTKIMLFISLISNLL